MSSSEYTFDLDDAQFVLFDQLQVDKQLASLSRFSDLDRDLYEATLSEAYKLAREVVAPCNKSGDEHGCKLDDQGSITTPPGYKEAWAQLRDGGWVAPRANPDLGGGGLPVALSMALIDILSGANMALMMYPGLTGGAGRVIEEHGPPEIAKKVAEKLFSGKWGGTMCLTEAGAGSSVGDNRARATPTKDAQIYELEGEKIFISGADQDFTENIVHLVLARTPNAPEGTRGLSLFLVPKFLFDKDLKVQERNGAHVLRIEHKMGINGSSTCVLGLGAKGTCRGWILGGEGQGMKLMFLMMNEARLGVAVQGLASGAAAFQYSRHYVHERVQGYALKDLKTPGAKKVSIAHHPDVRRMLMTQKVLVETMRSMVYRIGLDFDFSDHSDDEKIRERKLGRVDLLTPVAKSICSDLGFDVCVTAVQIFGGYGYVGEFPVEQTLRDCKIQSIYEGTNGIQALDLLGRKMRQGNGALFMAWMQWAQKQIDAAKKVGLDLAAQSINKAIAAVGASAMHIASVGKARDVDGAMVNAVPFLRAFGWVVLAVEAIDQARVAKELIDGGKTSTLLTGKLLNLEFYIAHILPQCIAMAKSIQSGDKSCLHPSLFMNEAEN